MVENKQRLRKESHLKRAIASIMMRMNDPYLRFVTITEIKFSPDKKKATVYYVVLEGKNVHPGKLKKASGFIKKKLPEYISLRHIPDLVFSYDNKVKKRENLEELFTELENERDNSDSE
ncbi:MAG: 30S ribosome-binding factor RbfA [candidate division WOR-3 bacterium]|nr:30S ribosome-binding factor RbfA [candidate division WOR-3 bacterium]